MKLLQQLINIPSYSGQETVIQKHISDWFISNKLQPIDVNGNTVIHIKGTNPKLAFICNAHVDTVREGTLQLWKDDPFHATILNKKMFGLGASDEKSGVALCMLLAKYFTTKKPPCDFWCMFVNQEETTGSGSLGCLSWFNLNYQKKYKHIAGLLPEPTGFETIEIGHKGNAFVKLTVVGESGHGSEPRAVKTNASLCMSEIFLALEKLEKKWKKYVDSTLGAPTIAVTSISSGDINSPNKIADSCVATLDIRTTPQLHPVTMQELRSFLYKYPVSVEYLFSPISPGVTNKNEVIIKAARVVLPHTAVSMSQGSTDLCFFSDFSIPAIIFGPGEKSSIHKPNEYCFPEKITSGVESIEKIITAWADMIEERQFEY